MRNARRKAKTTPPPSSSSRVPPELEIDILSRLPIKTLFRFRCVSKNWLHLLTQDSHFIQTHLDRTIQSKNPDIIVTEVGLMRKVVVYSGPNFDQPRVLRSPVKRSHDVIGCRNGILCLKHCRLDYGMYLWNPSTGEHFPIPTCPAIYHKDTYFGFGWHAGTNQYKVVVLSNPYDAPLTDVFVYTLGTATWRPIRQIPYRLYAGALGMPLGVLVHGALHWIVQKDNRHVVLSFNLEDEIFRVMRLPYNGNQHLGDMNGLLCSLTHYCVPALWMMQEYGSWVKVLEIKKSVENVMTLVGTQNNGQTIICRDLQRLLFFSREGILIKDIECPVCSNCQASCYFGSLVSPRAIAGGIGKSKDRQNSSSSGKGEKRKGTC